MPIFAWNIPLLSLNFLRRSQVFPILLFSSTSLCWSLREAFLFLLAIFWNSAFRWMYLSFSHLPFTSLLFSAINIYNSFWSIDYHSLQLCLISFFYRSYSLVLSHLLINQSLSLSLPSSLAIQYLSWIHSYQLLLHFLLPLASLAFLCLYLRFIIYNSTAPESDFEQSSFWPSPCLDSLTWHLHPNSSCDIYNTFSVNTSIKPLKNPSPISPSRDLLFPMLFHFRSL